MEGADKITVRIFKSITLVHEAGMVLLEVSHCWGIVGFSRETTLVSCLTAVPQSVDIWFGLC